MSWAISLTLEAPVNSKITVPRLENTSCSSLSRSKWPAVSMEKAWTLL